MKLIYIVPEYNEKTPTHFAYLYGFLKELEKEFDIFLIAEKKGNWLSDFLPVRIARVWAQIVWARMRGYRDVYIHYSFLAAFLSSITMRPLGGRVFYWNCGEPWKYKRNFFRETFELTTYKLITFLVTGTEGLKRQYAHHYNLSLEKIRVMPNWIDLEKLKVESLKLKDAELREKLDISAEAKVLLFVHRLSKRKGAHYLPEILKSLKDENVVLVIIGDGPERNALELKAKSLKLEANFRLLGWLPQSEVLDYFAIADVFIMPSEEEGFPHVLLEAMAAGVPFVASDVGGVKEIIPPEMSRYIVPVGAAREMSEKIKEIMQKPEHERGELKKAMHQWVEKYDITNALVRFREILSR